MIEVKKNQLDGANNIYSDGEYVGRTYKGKNLRVILDDDTFSLDELDEIVKKVKEYHHVK